MRLFLDDPRTVVVEEDEARRGVVGIIIKSDTDEEEVGAAAALVAPPCFCRFAWEGGVAVGVQLLGPASSSSATSAAPSTSSCLSSCWNNRTPLPRRFLVRYLVCFLISTVFDPRRLHGP